MEILIELDARLGTGGLWVELKAENTALIGTFYFLEKRSSRSCEKSDLNKVNSFLVAGDFRCSSEV